MAIIGLQRLTKKDLFTATLWNTLMDILEAKFASGVGSNDIQYPLIVQGDIDFGQTYGIVGLKEFWNIVNAAEYTTLDAAVSAAEATAGGAVFIPAYTTISASAVSIDASNITIFGAGKSSVVKITAASTGPLFTTGTTGLSGIEFMNLTLDGTGGGAGCVGVQVRRVDRFVMKNVYMTAFTGDFVVLTNGGVAGQSTTNAYLEAVHMNAGSDNHLVCDDVSGLVVIGFTSKSAAADAISMVAASSSHLIQDINIASSRIHSGGAKGIRIMGSGASGIDAHSRIKITDVAVVGCTGQPIELGGSANMLKKVDVKGCVATGATGDGLRIASLGGSVTGCDFQAASGDGIDMQNSIDLFVNGNGCKDAGAYGINAASTTDCEVIGNNCRDATTDGINRTSSSDLRALENVGDDAPTIGNAFYDNTTTTLTGTSTGTLGPNPILTIPANSLKTGDVIEIEAEIETGVGATGVVEMRLNALGWTAQAFAASKTYIYRTLIRAATGGANTSHLYTFLESGASPTIAIGGTPVDWTIDQAITFNVTTHGGSGDISLRRVVVRMSGSK